jgi:hypothetical protein
MVLTQKSVQLIINMKKKTDFTTDGFEVLGYFLLTAITVILFAYITN